MTTPKRIIFRHRRTTGSKPPGNIYEGEIAYSDTHHTLHVGRPGGGSRDIGGAACYVWHAAPQGQSGGSFEAGDWRVRPLNQISGNLSFCEISDGALRLVPGTYEVFGWAMALGVKSHRTRLSSSLGVLVWGDSAYANSWTESRSFLAGQFDLTVQTVVLLEHCCALSRNHWGYGYRSNFGPEIYAQLTLNKY